jgi:hypothetical protein
MELGRTTRNRWLHLGRIGLDERERKAADLRIGLSIAFKVLSSNSTLKMQRPEI